MTPDEIKTKTEAGETLLRSRPHNASPIALVNACLLLCVINAKKLDWSDALCMLVAAGNLLFYVFRATRYRSWERQRDAWLKQVK